MLLHSFTIGAWLVCTLISVKIGSYLIERMGTKLINIFHLGVIVSTLQFPKSFISGEYPDQPFVLFTSSDPYFNRKSRCFIANTVDLFASLSDRSPLVRYWEAKFDKRPKSVGKRMSHNSPGSSV